MLLAVGDWSRLVAISQWENNRLNGPELWSESFADSSTVCTRQITWLELPALAEPIVC